MEILAKILFVVAAVFVFGLLLAFPVMWLWNWLMPVIFGLPTITVWQAFGLKILSSLLFASSSISASKS